MKAKTDVELLEAFRRGRDEAFDELVRRHGQAIKAYALRMLKNPERAEEVFVDTFLRVARNRGQWENRGTVRGFLFTIAHRLCIDIQRKRKLEREAFPSLVDITRTWAQTPSPEAVAMLGQRAQQLEVALSRLSDAHRQVILLRLIHGLSARETGETLGLDEQQVHNQLSYARRRLREELDLGLAARGNT